MRLAIHRKRAVAWALAHATQRQLDLFKTRQHNHPRGLKPTLRKHTMKKLTADDPETKSVDLLAENIGKLQELFPEAFTEGKLDFDVLKQLLGGVVDEREEKYGLNWHGKRRARQAA